jgi:phenylacetate-CoA ligase
MREFAEIEEFKIETFLREELREIKLTVEPRPDCQSLANLDKKVSRTFRERLGLRPLVEVVASGTLPRFELKAKRFFKL